jgi:hypothetical protein
LGDTNGNPQKDGLPKEEASYKGNKKLRGRKFYLHQIPPNAKYWTRLNDGAPREYEAVDSTKGKQNRSIRDWIFPGRRFKFNIRVENITRGELGALLTLLTFPPDSYFKLGYAKPLGLGSVRLRLDLTEGSALPVFTGKEKAQRYRAFGVAPRAGCRGIDANAREDIILHYKMAMIETYSTGAAPVFPVPPVTPESWRDPQKCPGEGVDLVREDEGGKEALGTLWRNALQKGDPAFPFDALSEYSEFLDPNNRKALQEAYNQDKRVFDKDMKAFLKASRTAVDKPYFQLPFIEAFKNALEGKPVQEVYYPRNEPTDEGYKWFSGNERTRGASLIHGYSLPPMGEKLSETL